MSRRRKFAYGDYVRVKEPGRRAFYGTVYSEYRSGPRNGARMICVNTPSGCGVAYSMRYITHAKRSPGRGEVRLGRGA